MAEQIPHTQEDLSSPSRRHLILESLEYFFKTLKVLNKAYFHLYPAPPRHPPFQHVPHQQDRRHISEMAGQGERMTFIGMLLRTTDKIHCLELQHTEDHIDFALLMAELKIQRPDIAHGVAVLNFLTAGLCQNNMSTLVSLLDLVRALRESSKRCTHDRPPFRGALVDFYKGKECGRTLFLIAQCFYDHCRVCDSSNSNRIEECKRKLGADLDLDTLHQHGCRDCEIMLVDILVYTKILKNTNRRMMASLRLTLNYCVVNQLQNVIECQGQLKQLNECLFNEGFTVVKQCDSTSPDNTHLKISLDYEAIYISGWRDDEKSGMRDLLDGFLENKDSRLFFIQCKHQVLGANGRPHCCEPQIMEHLNEVIIKLSKAHLIQSIDMHMMLEQDPCRECRKVIMPTIRKKLDASRIPLQLITMLEYKKRSKSEQSTSDQSALVFLERLTQVPEPVVHLKCLDGIPLPSEMKHSCIRKTCGDCRYIRCYGHFKADDLSLDLYSKPSIALMVDSEKLRRHSGQ